MLLVRPLQVLLLLGTALIVCGSPGCVPDPNHARLVNDLDVHVRLRLCSSNDCQDGFYPPDELLPPGEDWQVNVSSRGVPNVYLVETPAAEVRYGCLPLVSPAGKHEVAVRVSEHVQCRSHLDEEQFWPKRW